MCWTGSDTPALSRKAIAHGTRIEGAHGGILDAVDESVNLLLQLGLALGRRPVAGSEFPFPQGFGQRLRPVENPVHCLGALLADEIVGVEAVGQEREAGAEPGFQVRQDGIDGAMCGFLAGAVTVKAQDRLRHEAPDELHLILG